MTLKKPNTHLNSPPNLESKSKIPNPVMVCTFILLSTKKYIPNIYSISSICIIPLLNTSSLSITDSPLQNGFGFKFKNSNSWGDSIKPNKLPFPLEMTWLYVTKLLLSKYWWDCSWNWEWKASYDTNWDGPRLLWSA